MSDIASKGALGGTARLRRLHSLCGVFPVGVFFVLLIGAHARALWGPDAHRAAMQPWPLQPLWHALILIPFAFHAGYGVVLAARPRYNVGRYPYAGNWSYVLLRMSGLVALAFALLHLGLFWLPQIRGELGPAELYFAMEHALSSTAFGLPLLGFAYLIGLGACAYHFAAGLWSFAARWGLMVSRRSRTRLGASLAIFGLGLFAVGANTVIGLATGAPLVGPFQAESQAESGAP